jgi:hypothetical protein
MFRTLAAILETLVARDERKSIRIVPPGLQW